MNATTIPHPTSGPPASAVDYVRSLPPEEKQAVFLALLREALQLHGEDGPLPVEDEEGNPFGCYLPPKAVAARAEAALPKMTAEREAELAKRQTEPGRMLTEEKFREWLKQATPAQSQ